MKRSEAILSSAAFFVIAPGTVAGLIPWWITRWRAGGDASLSLSVAGAVLGLAGLWLLIDCFARFALKGEGTPAPIAPTKRLVVDGFYRRMRNPMYLAVLMLVGAQMLIFASAALMAYAITLWIVFHIFVLAYEEPTLKQRHPQDYEAYVEAVPRWRPRFIPWRGEADEAQTQAREAETPQD